MSSFNQISFSNINPRPILSAEEYANAETTIGKFSAPGGVGEQALQVGLSLLGKVESLRLEEQVLEKRRRDLDNWAYSYWLDEMYMEPRLPLPVNSNPGGSSGTMLIRGHYQFFHDHRPSILNPGMVFPRQSFNGIGQMLAFTR